MGKGASGKSFNNFSEAPLVIFRQMHVSPIKWACSGSISNSLDQAESEFVWLFSYVY